MIDCPVILQLWNKIELEFPNIIDESLTNKENWDIWMKMKISLQLKIYLFIYLFIYLLSNITLEIPERRVLLDGCKTV